MVKLYEHSLCDDVIEICNPNSNSVLAFYGNWSTGIFHEIIQTFTIGTNGSNESHYIHSLRLPLCRSRDNPGFFGTGNVRIYNVDSSNHPTGAALCTGTFDGETMPLVNEGPFGSIWTSVDLQPHAYLLKDTSYAFVIQLPECPGIPNAGLAYSCCLPYGSEHVWLHDVVTDTYSENPNTSIGFEEYGEPANAWISTNAIMNMMGGH